MTTIASTLWRSLLGRLFNISRRTVLIVSALLLLVLALLAWAAISFAGWLFGVAQQGADALPGSLATVTSQAEKLVPEAREAIASVLPALKPATPLREVSGSDPAPVARFPGMVRVAWQADGGDVQVRYQGTAALSDVLAHYVREFAAQGYRQEIISAAANEERHRYRRGDSVFTLRFAAEGSGSVVIDLRSGASLAGETTSPASARRT